MSIRRSILTIIIVELLLALVCGGVVAYLVTTTNPYQLGPVGVTIWFVAVFVGIASLMSMLNFCWRVRKKSERERVVSNLKDSIRVGLLVSITLTVLLGLSSLKSLTVRDMILFVITVVLIELYFRTRKADTKV